MSIHKSVKNLLSIEESIKSKILLKDIPQIIAVSKTFPLSDILPLINYGHINYGENKAQEATSKWGEIKKTLPKIKLHMIGKIQTNKVKYIVPLFDYIHTLDNIKLADKIANEQIKQNKKLKIFIQINIGDEIQKNGLNIDNLNLFYEQCIKEFKLDITGIMCIPPINLDNKDHYIKMNELKENLGVSHLSMGMSQDYLDAAKNNSTYLRIGSKIFGQRG
tara:strand:- start:480 stop:1139 length:660 start_codon:yes stop_codon:yes gene_type:complete